MEATKKEKLKEINKLVKSALMQYGELYGGDVMHSDNWQVMSSLLDAQYLIELKQHGID